MGIEEEPTRRSTERSRPARADGLLDINVLPQRHRKARLRWASVAPWLSLLGLIILVYPTFQWFVATNDEFGLVARDLAHMRSTQIALQTPSGTESALSTQIASVNDQTQGIRAAADSLNLQQIAWGETIQRALDLAPLGVDVSSVVQTEDQVEITGLASSYQIPLAYAQRLKDSGRFSDVSVSVVSRNPEASPTPSSASPTPSTSAGQPSFTFRLSLLLPTSNAATPTPEVTLAP
jgi:hypothetical protein